MKLGLQLRLKQTLAPQLIQSLKMVQAPVLKLEQMLRMELATNPMLEEIEELEPDTTDTTDTELDLASSANPADNFTADESPDCTAIVSTSVYNFQASEFTVPCWEGCHSPLRIVPRPKVPIVSLPTSLAQSVS